MPISHRHDNSAGTYIKHGCSIEVSKRMAVVLVVLFFSMVTATTTSNRRICGEELADTLSLVCNGSFNKRSSGIFKLKRNIATRYINHQVKRTEEYGGVVEECCLREEGCSFFTLMSYCSVAPPEHVYENYLANSNEGESNSDDADATTTTPASVTTTEQITTSTERSVDRIFTSYVNRWLNSRRFTASTRPWFFIPGVQIGPSPTRRPYQTGTG